MSMCNERILAPFVVKGAVFSPTIGRCGKEALPGMTVCSEHATREGMAYYIRHLSEQLEALKAKAPKKRRSKA